MERKGSMLKNLSTSELALLLEEMSPIHFIGVNGSGMRPLAEFTASLMKAANTLVTGSDVGGNAHVSHILFGVEGSEEAFALLDKARTVVFSSAITPNHPALVRASQRGLKILHRSELLAIFSRYYRAITVAGTHGKSTTSALIAHALTVLGRDPSWIIGAAFANGAPSFHRGASDLLVLEADESDGSFLRYTPTVAVLNNIESDHMDYYQTIGRLEEAFGAYVAKVPAEGALAYWCDSPAVLRATNTFQGRACTFGTSAEARLRLLDHRAEGLSTTATMTADGYKVSFTLPLPGQHNLLNAMAAISACCLLGLSAESVAGSLGSFPGVKRRLQRYYAKGPALIFDDYAHNPGKIRSCLEGLAASFPHKRIIAVFQPHRFSRISSLYSEFIAAFEGFNMTVVVVPVYASGEMPMQGFSEDNIARDIGTSSRVTALAVPSLDHATQLIQSTFDVSADVVVTLGAGDVWRVADSLSRQL
jgi:UDP-N-acetylmuramate--alanine ligase